MGYSVFYDSYNYCSLSVWPFDKAVPAKIWQFAKMALDVTIMNKEAILKQLSDGPSTRMDILKAAQNIDPSFKETQLRYLLGVCISN